MTNKDAIDFFEDNFVVINSHGHNTEEEENEAVNMAINAFVLLDTLTDRPCSVCRHRKENGCSKWDCVFDGHIGG